MIMDKDKKTVYIDDSVEIGKEPLPINDEETQRTHDELMKKYKNQK